MTLLVFLAGWLYGATVMVAAHRLPWRHQCAMHARLVVAPLIALAILA